ncbi:MAG: ribosome biosynthesis protein rrb1 [Alyxoria varia]|nr:MAG: ribosome biosynthesis protein rrb1 [Alyxoria varia]
MSKRAAQLENGEDAALKRGERPLSTENGVTEDQIFEDEFEDEFESEDEIMEAGIDGRPDAEREAEQQEETGDRMDVDDNAAERQTFIPGRTKLPAGEILSPDLSTYEMLHTLQAPWPCLSFDIVRDNLGDGRARKKYPATVYAVAGTQAAHGHERENEILVMKMSKLSKMDRPDEEDGDEGADEDSDDEAVDAEPILETKSIPTDSCTNRIRAHQTPTSGADPLEPYFTQTAAMMESGEVLIHDISRHLSVFDTPGLTLDSSHSKPLHRITSHGRDEGFALDWSPSRFPSNNANAATIYPKLLTGDIAGKIHLTTQSPSGSWTTETHGKPFTGHTSSVEELHWSPSEPSVFASASVDSTVKIWDTRSKTRKPALSVPVSNTDVNVLSWSAQTSYLLATGADDGVWAAWDLRAWRSSKGGGVEKPQPVASFGFHKAQVTSVEWHPSDDSVVAVAAGDDTISLWDLAVEPDEEEEAQQRLKQGSSRDKAVDSVPPQLLFVHYMEQVKECHWHPQSQGQIMATGGSGFGVFKTISV